MIKIKKGNTRIALILFSWLVIKLPNLRFDWLYRKDYGRIRWSVRSYFTDGLYTAFLYATTANICEALLYRYMRSGHGAPFLTPVFSVGICSFQLYQGEEVPTREEIIALEASLSEKAKFLLQDCELHQWMEHNWRKTPKGLRLIDYAPDPLRTSWARFIRGHEHELIPLTRFQVK